MGAVDRCRFKVKETPDAINIEGSYHHWVMHKAIINQQKKYSVRILYRDQQDRKQDSGDFRDALGKLLIG
jgi:hypothetical protein